MVDTPQGRERATTILVAEDDDALRALVTRVFWDQGFRTLEARHGGEALHAFNRASFGTPQSLGCVELPLDQAAKVWPYTPIGTLVTIEN